jgi:ribonucleotide monophosphatase NagD (HAD superfamily)
VKDTLFIIDLDGVVFNSEERFKRATKDGKIDWSIAFNPQLLHLDTLIPGAYDAIGQLESKGDIIYLTSRPESLYVETRLKLKEFGLLRAEVICKPESAQYVKTLKWKAEEVRKIILDERDYDIITVIDDEPKNLQAVKDLGLSNVECFESLEQALEAIGGQDTSEDISPEADIIMQNIDPSVRNAWEEEIINPSPRRAGDDGGPAIII